MSSASQNWVSYQGGLDVNYPAGHGPSVTWFGQFSVQKTPFPGTNRDHPVGPRASRVAKCRLLQDKVDGLLPEKKTRTTDNEEDTIHPLLVTVSPGRRQERSRISNCWRWREAYFDLELAALKDLTPENMKYCRSIRSNPIRSFGREEGRCKIMVIDNMNWGKMDNLDKSPDEICRQSKQERLVTKESWSGSVTGNSTGFCQIIGHVGDLSELVLRFNKNNNSNANEERESDAKGNATEVSKSRHGISKSNQTTATKSRHSYQNRRRSRETGQARAEKTNYVNNHDNKTMSRATEQRRMAIVRDYMVAGSSGEPKKGNSSEIKNPCVKREETIAVPDKAECYTPVLKDLLKTLSNYKMSADVPPMFKEDLFQVFLPFLDGGFNSDESVLTNLERKSVLQSPDFLKDSPKHFASVHDQCSRELAEQAAVSINFSPEYTHVVDRCDRGLAAQATEMRPAVVSTNEDISIDFSPEYSHIVNQCDRRLATEATVIRPAVVSTNEDISIDFSPEYPDIVYRCDRRLATQATVTRPVVVSTNEDISIDFSPESSDIVDRRDRGLATQATVIRSAVLSTNEDISIDFSPEYSHIVNQCDRRLPTQATVIRSAVLSTNEDISIDFSPVYPDIVGEDPDIHKDSLLFIDHFPDDEDNLPLVQDIGSPSFVSLGQHGYSGAVFDVNFLAHQEQGNIAIDDCYAFGPVIPPVGVSYHTDAIHDEETFADEIITNIQEPFPSEYVFRMVFGFSFTIPSEFWLIQPPILPSRVIQFKVHEDGISDKVIGQGCFGQVVEATLLVHLGESRDVVIKEHYMGKATKGDIVKEAKISMYLESTGCVPICYGLLRDTYGNISIVQELFGSGITLHHLLYKKTLPREDWLNIACQLAAGLGRIHDKNILINDLKADNILVDMSHSVPQAKYCDMGSASYKYGVIYEDENMDKYAHLAPEVRAYSETSKANDVYSLGRVIKKMYTASRISALTPVYLQCMAQNPADRLSLAELFALLTKITRNELMFPPITVTSNGYRLPSSSESSENGYDSLEHRAVQEHDDAVKPNSLVLAVVPVEDTISPLTKSANKKLDTVPATTVDIMPDVHTSVPTELDDSGRLSPTGSSLATNIKNMSAHLVSTSPSLKPSQVRMQTEPSQVSPPGVSDSSVDDQNIFISAESTLPDQEEHGEILKTGRILAPKPANSSPTNFNNTKSSTTDIGNEMSAMSSAEFVTATTSPQMSPIFFTPRGKCPTSASSPLWITPRDVEDTSTYFTPFEREASFPKYLTPTATELYTVKQYTPCTGVATNQHICDKELEKYHTLCESEPDCHSHLILVLLLLVLLFCGVLGLI